MPKAIDGWKTCSKCQEEQPISEFYKNKRNVDGLCCQCKVCDQAYRQGEKGKVVQQHYRQSEKGKAADRRYRQSDGGKVALQVVNEHYQQSPKGEATQKRYHQSNRGKVADRRACRQRRVRKAGCVGSHTREEFLDLCKLYDFRCLRCGDQFPIKELIEDHIIPIGPGVSDNIDNIQPLCRPCNSRKGRRTIDYRRTTKA